MKVVRKRTSFDAANSDTAGVMAAVPPATHHHRRFVIMSAKQLILASALGLALAGAASAQTVPAEAWVGAPIATTGGQLHRGAVVSAMQQFMTQPQAAPEGWVGTVASAGIAVGEVRRSEVMADFNLYRRAGLADYATRDSFDPRAAEPRRRLAVYQSLRAGPEFAQEVARIEGALTATAKTKGSAAGSD
jgi:hypothetical protein